VYGTNVLDFILIFVSGLRKKKMMMLELVV